MNAFRMFILFFFISLSASFLAQSDTIIRSKRKLTFYASWGYNRETYTKSTIRFRNDGDLAKEQHNDPAYSAYDFTLYNVKATDKPGFNQIAGSWNDLINLTVPQFSCRIGVYFNNDRDEGFELNYDHAKYVVLDGQNVHIKGTMLGQYFDKDTSFTPNNFHFEHTDGANFFMANYIKRWKIWKGKNKRNNLGIMFKPGAGIVVPRTDCTIFGERVNNSWRVAGFIAGFETGIRGEFLKHFCFELTGKAAYASYLWCFVHYKGNGQASHSFGTLVANFNLGYRFNGNRPAFKKGKK